MAQYRLTESEIKKLKKIAKRAIIQSFQHKGNIVEYFHIIIQAAKDEFTEDNRETLTFFLNECYEEALNRSNIVKVKVKTSISKEEE